MAARGDINNQDVEPILFEEWFKLDFDQCLDNAGAFSKLKSSDYFEQGEYPVIDQGEKYISGFINDENLLYKGELPVIIFGDHTRIFKYVTDTFAVGADGTKILKPIKAFDPKFFFYYMKSLTVPSLGYSRHYKVLNSIEVPLPPLPEQQRIVAKLDTLFGQLDRIKTGMERIPQLLKDFRQKVLTQAVTGKLTEEWREGRELQEWKNEKLDDISERITVGYVGKMIDQYRDSGIPFLRSQNVRAFRFSDINLLFISAEFNEEIKKSKLHPGDVVIVRSGYPGTTCVIPDTLVEANCSDILICTPKKERLNPHFVSIFMNSDYGKEIVFQGRVGNAQQHFNTKTLKTTIIPLPSLVEQQEIVRRVESLFAKADRIEVIHQKLKAKIDALPQALLAKAFRGELVEQLPTDGDARDLLEQIKQAKEGLEKGGKGRKMKVVDELNLAAEPKGRYGKK